MHHSHAGRVAIWALAAALTVTGCAGEGPTGGAASGVRQGDVIISEQPDPSETTPSSPTPTPAVTAKVGEPTKYVAKSLIPVSFSPGQSSLVDSAGRTFSVHSDATFALTDAEDRESFPTINPTGSAEMALVFDMPADSTPTLLHLRDGFQTGVDFVLG